MPIYFDLKNKKFRFVIGTIVYPAKEDPLSQNQLIRPS